MSRLVGAAISYPPAGVGSLGPKDAPPSALDNYLERVAKYIPGEIIAAYIAIRNILPSASHPDHLPTSAYTAIYAALVILTALYLWRTGGAVPKKPTQTLIGAIAFVIWSYAIGGFPFDALQLTNPPLGATGLILSALAFGLFDPRAH